MHRATQNSHQSILPSQIEHLTPRTTRCPTRSSNQPLNEVIPCESPPRTTAPPAEPPRPPASLHTRTIQPLTTTRPSPVRDRDPPPTRTHTRPRTQTPRTQAPPQPAEESFTLHPQCDPPLERIELETSAPRASDERKTPDDQTTTPPHNNNNIIIVIIIIERGKHGSWERSSIAMAVPSTCLGLAPGGWGEWGEGGCERCFKLT